MASWMVMTGWLLTLGGAAYLTFSLSDGDKEIFQPGEISHGHYLIAKQCDVCHGDSFSGDEALEASCVKCHKQELKEADDSHPLRIFRDPRNADQLAILDARKCVTCHLEHRPEVTRKVGVTLPDDFCFPCHEKIVEERSSSHRNLDPAGCAAAGCHNYHDNRGLYEAFLLKNTQKVMVKKIPRVPAIQYLEGEQEKQRAVLTREHHDAPKTLEVEERILDDWQSSAHAKSGVNCGHCHSDNKKMPWASKPDHKTCQRCHQRSIKDYLAGKHGMRLAQELSPLTPSMARLPMKEKASDKQHGCHVCHKAHKRDPAYEAVEACLACHDDEHSRAYKLSLHYQLWQQELADESAAQTGVSCATCHLPRQIIRREGQDVVWVQHNQNDNLRPNEKMLRSVCLYCHGLAFSLDALADEKLVNNNFKGQPALHVKSIDMAKKRELDKKLARQMTGGIKHEK